MRTTSSRNSIYDTIELIALLAFLTVGTSAESASPIFRSGFEKDVLTTPPQRGGEELWSAHLQGRDMSTGFTWPIGLWGVSREYLFMYCMAPPPNINDCMNTRIEEVTGPHNSPTRTLYMDILAGRNVSRNEHYFETFPQGEKTDLYTSYWLKMGNEVQRGLVPILIKRPS